MAAGKVRGVCAAADPVRDNRTSAAIEVVRSITTAEMQEPAKR
jgi:hypothetical protein